MQKWQVRTKKLAVWELTLACNLRCNHCGSAAGKPREGELGVDQLLDVIGLLVQEGVGEVTLIGGEATLRPDWPIVVEALVNAGIDVTIQTGGYHIDQAISERFVDLGVKAVGVSIDGLSETHNQLRGRPDSYEHALNALVNLRRAGIKKVGVYTQVNRLNFSEIPQLFDVLIDHGVSGWQLSPTIPMGSAVANELLCFQPCDFEALHELMAVLSVAGLQQFISVTPTNAMGYFGPYERLIRSSGDILRVYPSCPAGDRVIGIEADGTVKGCPSLPTDLFATGNVLEDGLENLNRAYHQAHDKNPHRDPNIYRKTLKGFCSTCPFSPVCKAGCPWASTSIHGERGDNPYCMFRSIVNNANGTAEYMKCLDVGTLSPFSRGSYSVYNSNDSTDKVTPKPLSLEAIEWPTRLQPIASAFADRRHQVRTETLRAYNEFRSFPLYKSEVSADLLFQLEDLCLPTVANQVMAAEGLLQSDEVPA